MINFNQKSYFEVQEIKQATTSINLININELVAVNYNYEQFRNQTKKRLFII